MKSIDPQQIDRLPGVRLGERDGFSFRCHAGLECFNRCCRNLNLFLYPYDVLRLRRSIGISSDTFLDRHVDVVMRPDSFFPDVLLKMADNAEKTCPFLTEDGCRVYVDRPDTCRTFPVEQGALYEAATKTTRRVSFFRPPDFCLGQHESTRWTLKTWAEDQQAVLYNRMTLEWAEIRGLLQTNPFGSEGAGGPKAKMAFMAAYNIDRFRDFVFQSSFFDRYPVKSKVRKKIKTSDLDLLRLGFEWIKLFLFGIRGKLLSP